MRKQWIPGPTFLLPAHSSAKKEGLGTRLTMYVLLSRLLYSPTCMCVQCAYFYHDCCTPLHACVYNVHTSITTAVLPYMHVCTMYILLSRLLYSPTCMCVQCAYFYHDCYIYSPTCTCTGSRLSLVMLVVGVVIIVFSLVLWAAVMLQVLLQSSELSNYISQSSPA